MREILRKIRAAVFRAFFSCIEVASRLFVGANNDILESTMLAVCQALETEKEYPAFQIKPKDTASIPILGG